MAEQELSTKYHPSTLLASSKTDQLEFIELLLNTSKKMQMHALLICRSAFDEYEKLPNKTDSIQFFEMFWDQIHLQQQKGQFSTGLTAMAFLIDSLIVIDTIKDKLKSMQMNHFLQAAFLSADALQQKYVVYILRKLSAENSAINIAWKTFFLIYDTSMEKQSHLIYPVLDMMHKTEPLPYGWQSVLMCHLLKTPNTYVLQRVVTIGLAIDIQKTAPHQLTFIDHLLEALNNTALFQNSVCTIKSLQDFITNCGSVTQTLQIKISKMNNWKPVPFYHICMALVESRTFDHSDSDNILTNMVNHAATIPNVWLRNTLLKRLSDVTSDQCDWISGLDNVEDYLHLKNDNIFLIRSINVHLNEFITATVSTTFKIVCQYLNETITKAEVLNEVLKTIKETMPGIQVELYDHDKNTEQRKKLNFLILSKSNAFVLITQMINNTTFVRMATSPSEFSTKLFYTLSGYQLRLAIHLLKENLKTISTSELDDMLQNIFNELLSGKQSTKLLSSFLDVLDQDKVPDNIQIKFYQLIANVAPTKNKWMIIFTPQLLAHVTTTINCMLFNDYIYTALLCGKAIKGDQRIELELCYDVHGGNIPSECIEHITTRRMVILWLLDLNPKDNTTTLLLSYLKERCLSRSAALYASKPRYYANSEHHRLKLRLIQVLAAIVSVDAVWDERFADALMNENNQLNVTFILECIIAYTIEPDRLLDLLNQSKSPNVRRSIFMIMYYVCKSKRTDIVFVRKCIQAMMLWTMGKDFNSRVLSQVIIKKLLEHFKFIEEYRIYYDSIEANLGHIDQRENNVRVLKDFRFSIDCTKLLNRGYYLCAIPTLTGMACDELFPVSSLNNDKDFVELLADCEHIVKNESLIRTEYVEINVNNVQRKIVPIKELFPDYSNEIEAKRVTDHGLIVVASLITRLANLGGLSRTCEIFGAEKLILDSIKQTENQEFQALSMTSEKWLHIGEIKPFHLVDYLVAMRNEGYYIIGAEQTANGIQINDLKFPKKSVLLLGNEKDGIPANLLSLLDVAVEIPQFGVIRSLNVHVTGALFIWEYAKQHNMFSK